MVSMKVTLSAAMRARDVSRPRTDHLSEAAEREAPMPAGHAAAATPAPAPEPPQPRTRRRRRRTR